MVQDDLLFLLLFSSVKNYGLLEEILARVIVVLIPTGGVG